MLPDLELRPDLEPERDLLRDRLLDEPDRDRDLDLDREDLEPERDLDLDLDLETDLEDPDLEWSLRERPRCPFLALTFCLCLRSSTSLAISHLMVRPQTKAPFISLAAAMASAWSLNSM